MEMKLIEGNFSKTDALELVTQLFQVKINFHEKKILSNSSLEDIKSRENKIKKLQQELSDFKSSLKNEESNFEIQSNIILKN
jgi:hypothetical protein